MTAPQFKELARRIAVFEALVQGPFNRAGIAPSVRGRMWEKVLKGQYDEDLDSIITDCDEEIPEDSPKALDLHLKTTYSVFQDALQLQSAKSGGAEAGSSAATMSMTMDSSEWYLSAIKCDVLAFERRVNENKATQRLSQQGLTLLESAPVVSVHVALQFRS